MRTEVFFSRGTDEDRKADVLSAFEEAGVSIARDGPLAIKSVDVFGVRIDVAFILEATIAGLIFEAEKEALRRGIDALRSKWQASGIVTIDRTRRDVETPPTVYFVPDGAEGDAALAAIDADYANSPEGLRLWFPGVGWRSMDEVTAIQGEAERLRREGEDSV